MYYNIGTWLFYHQKPKRGRYKPVHPVLFASFGSWAHLTKRHRKGAYRPRRS